MLGMRSHERLHLITRLLVAAYQCVDAFKQLPFFHEQKGKKGKISRENMGDTNMEDITIGADSELNEAIRIILSTSGFETDDPQVFHQVELSIRKKLETICSNARFYAGTQEDPHDAQVLQLAQLKPALNEQQIRIDRPDFILEQPQSKMTTRRTRSEKSGGKP